MSLIMTLTLPICPPAPKAHPTMPPVAAGGLDRGQLGAPLLFLAVRAELLEIGPQIVLFLLVFDAREHHLGFRDLGARILDVVLEGRLVPDDAGILVGVGIIEVRDAAGLAAVEAIEFG